MATIVTRAGKGSALTHNEADANFVNLNNAKFEAGNNATFGTVGGTTITASAGFAGALNGTVGATTPAAVSSTNLAYTGTLTGGTGVVNLGSGQFAKDASGNVGIGTGSPSMKLDIIGASNTNRGLIVKAASDNGAYIQLTDLGSHEYYVGTPNNENALVFGKDRNVASDGSELMRINSSGNVGIGTSSPSAKLDVSVAGANLVQQLSGTSGVFTRLGTASSSFYTVHNGATDTFLYTQEAAVLRFGTNAAERMRITSAGNVGVGTSNPTSPLTVENNNLGTTAGDVKQLIRTNTTTANGASLLISTYRISNGSDWQSAGTRIQQLVDATSHAYMQFNGNNNEGISFGTGGNANPLSVAERMRIDSAGNVGIGTSSPSATLNVNGPTQFTGGGTFPTAGSGIEIVGTVAGGINYIQAYNRTGNTWQELNINTGITAFSTSGSERMRIDSFGNVNIGRSSGGATTLGNTFGLSASGLGYNEAVSTNAGGTLALWYMNRQSSTGEVIVFRQAATGVGSITVTGSTTSYNITSDYRLKENIQPMVGALDKVAQLKPVTYNWKADGSDGQGFIAHELQAVVPDAVTGEKDAVDKDGKPVYQGIDTSFLVATLTKAIQEQQALIENLTTRLTALEGN